MSVLSNRIVNNLLNLSLSGLRNVLRKSRTHRRSDDSLELQPLHTPSKGVLRRMPRVRSDELSQEDQQHENGQHHPESSHKETVTSPLGAGLPLLSRLRLLKEKQVTNSTWNKQKVKMPKSFL